MTPNRTTRLAGAAGALLLATTALAACGDDDDDATATTTSTTTTAAVDDGPVEIVAVDYAYEDVPESIAAGTQLTLRNDSDAEIHELVAFRLPDGDDRSIDDIAKLPPGELMALMGGEPATVLLAPPGGEVIPAVGDGTLADAGRYAIICVIPTGADPDEYLKAAAESEGGPPEVDGGPPHIANGMYAELIVE